jgi:asparagine synthase (glutamine-hydrolysing)
MIYVGLIHWNCASDGAQDLCSTIASYTKTPPIVINKKSLTLVYGKLSSVQDVDEVWESENSLVVGRIFDKANKTSVEKKDFKNSSSLSKEEILEKIWGKYVYIEVNKENSQFDIVIDSTGQIPCFYYTFPNGDLLFSSDIEVLLKALARKLEYNWTYLCSYLVYSNSSAVQTPFQNIFEIPPACCLKITKNERKTTLFWNPLSTYKKQDIQNKDAADVLQDTLKPWIEPYKNICVSLSGGLDSSSLVYCLKNIVKKDQALSALNYFHSSIQSSNEVIYARKVCEETGIELIELDASDCLPFDAPCKNRLLGPNKPFPGLISLKWLEIVSDHIPSTDSCTFLSGHGSDHIFMRPPSRKSISDYILEKGLKGSKTQLNNITQFYRDSLFPILKENVISLSSYALSRRLNKRHHKNTQDELPPWMTRTLHQKTSTSFVHPIYEILPQKILPGKYAQIDAFYEGLASIHMEMDTAYPFLYEPVVEFALSFSTYELFNQGYDRYPLRQSISEKFRTETVWRRDKSATTGIFQLGVKKNLEDILDLCLEGQCVKQGIVNKDSLRETIILIGNGDINHMWPFIHLASIEIFLRYWNEKVL